MERLVNKHIEKVNRISLTFQRDFRNAVHWDERLIGIMGQRGVGKTTLLLQYIKSNYKTKGDALYVSLDDLYFTKNTIVSLAEEFQKAGGKYLFLDEIHRYADWARELKVIYDDFPDLKVVFTGSSILQIINSKGDLSRRAAFYSLKGLSLREYINYTKKKNLPVLTWDDIINNHQELCHELKKEFKPLVLFREYMKMGYFPFFIEYPKTYYQRLEEIINITIDIDLLSLKGLNTSGILKLKHLLYIIAQSVPFKPNITDLSSRIGVNRNTLVSYLNHLDDAGIIRCLYSSATGIGALQKPEKIYLENTCFNYSLSEETPNIGTLRETFFISQVKPLHKLTYTSKGDFVVNGKYHIEVGGQNKTDKQVKGISNSFIAADEIEVGYKNRIPLWLFGMLY